ncbi:copper fist DNA binding domain-containing protein [Phlyctema vagabunda]|uniref:Copper fist DNA binding domain-containing protein n=1 Tax=Phlyctema vagabunda TaxID=108571 RepID=A0ABR4PF68_9HELO
MLIAGEKYACEACVRGHRVSNCQHSDRPLQHINKKGRPVSQCTHCRTLRKSRSAHVRCECGEKNAHAKGACNHDGDPAGDNCCCSHGARCSCALKKEHLDPVPESDSDEASSSSTPNELRRPRAATTQSENCLTIFTNGHHKPVHKHNNMAHKCGLPYVVPRAHSIHGASPSNLANRSVDNLPHTNAVEALHGDSHLKDSIVSAQQEQRMVKSEHGSPHLSPVSNLDQLNGQLPPLDFAAVNDYTFFQNLDNFSAVDSEQPIFSAGLSAASIDWSHYDGLDFNNDNFATSTYSQAPSFTGFDFSSIDQPALTTTSTSGEISEVEDFGIPLNDPLNRPTIANHRHGSDYNSDYGGEIDKYRLSTASSFVGLPQAQMLAGNAEAFDLEEFMKASSCTPLSDNGTTALPTMNGGFVDGCKPFDGLSVSGSYPGDMMKATHNHSSFEDSTFQLLPGEEEIDWANAFPNSAISVGEIPIDNIWAAQ